MQAICSIAATILVLAGPGECKTPANGVTSSAGDGQRPLTCQRSRLAEAAEPAAAPQSAARAEAAVAVGQASSA